MSTQPQGRPATNESPASHHHHPATLPHSHDGAGGIAHHGQPAQGRYLYVLALTALGVAYGDIGTSPLYALRESFHGTHSINVNPANIEGVLSLVFWSLIIVVTVKYIFFILRADNRGEGGIMALTSLATPIRPLQASPRRGLVLLGVFGAALLYGDAMITPAISVLSAVEGLTVATPQFKPYIVPITVGILVGLFLIQSRGTASLGKMFGPVMLVWFIVLSILGITNILQNPGILVAVNPLFGLRFFMDNGWVGFLTLGTVFLVVTGGESLYADMGHVGRTPIRMAWLGLVLPALLLNYFGQGALLLRNPEAAANLFYLMAPSWALYPLVILAALATIIASQALISGVFSITMQAENLGFLPRVRVVHTSATEFGQIYLPFVNWALMIGCIAVVIGFQTSSNLAAAYGIAVTSTMVITTIMFSVVARQRWKWSGAVVGGIVGFLLTIDLAFLGANIVKIPQGGWFPLVAAVLIFTAMTTWKRGTRLVNTREQNLELPLSQLLTNCKQRGPVRAPGTAVFLSANQDSAPAALLANFQYNNVIHERVLLVNVQITGAAHVLEDERASYQDLGQGFYRVTIRYGFMEELDVPKALARLADQGLAIDPQRVPYFIGRTKVLPSAMPGMALWREQLYTVMQRNATSAADFFRLPPAQVVEISTSVEV